MTMNNKHIFRSMFTLAEIGERFGKMGFEVTYKLKDEEVIEIVVHNDEGFRFVVGRDNDGQVK